MHYVDFGNCEYVPNERLRKHVILTDIPAQCTPYKLYNIETVSPLGYSVNIISLVNNYFVVNIFPGSNIIIDIAGPSERIFIP